ncbi:MAG: hypothetical protein ACI909_000146 [Planctomycetota bacterium]
MSSIAPWVLFFFLFQTPVNAADTISLQLDSLQTSFFSTGAITFTYGPQESESPGISLQVVNIHSPYIENNLSISLRCIESSFTGQTLECAEGEMHIDSPGEEMIEAHFNFQINIIDYSAQLTMVAASKWGSIKVSYVANEQRQWHLDVNGEAVYIPVFSKLMQSQLDVFREHVITDGKADIQAKINGLASNINDVALTLDVMDLGIEGLSILDKVGLQLQSDFTRSGHDWSFNNSLSLLAGEMYIQPGMTFLGDTPGFYIASSGDPGIVRINGSWSRAEKVVELSDLYYLHPKIIEMQGSARVVMGEEINFSDLVLQAKVEDMSQTYPVYIQPILLQTNFSNLELSGALDLSLDYRDSNLEKMDLLIEDVYLDDIESRFSISGLNTHLVLDNMQKAVQSTLQWSGMSFYKLDFGSGDIVFESVGKDVNVLHWQDVSILDGALKIDEFSIRNFASSDFELKLGGELKPISMTSLTHALGWTIFPGKLSGGISGLKYAHNKLQLEGDISVSLFGGLLNIRELQVEDLFSSYSVLTTDIKIDRLDLEQLTDVFTFGKIEGSLSGRMDKLRLEDWKPSYFEAEFATLLDDDKPHRISQKALENLNELGGGLGGTLSRGFLRFLPAYSYGRLGLSCRLFNGVCELGGVEDSGESFSILTKGGLLPPWVEVKGAGRSIKWDDLIDGLKQIAKGDVEIE